MFCEQTQRFLGNVIVLHENANVLRANTFLGEPNSFCERIQMVCERTQSSLGNVIVWRENATFLRGTQYFWKESTNVSQGNAIILRRNAKALKSSSRLTFHPHVL